MEQVLDNAESNPVAEEKHLEDTLPTSGETRPTFSLPGLFMSSEDPQLVSHVQPADISEAQTGSDGMNIDFTAIQLEPQAATVTVQSQPTELEDSASPREEDAITDMLPETLQHTSLQSPSVSAPLQPLPDLGTGHEQISEVNDAEIALQPNEQPTNEEKPPVNGAEVEYDSSPYESSTDDSSSDDSEDSDEDYELLDPAEQARRLMEGDGSDDEGNKTTTGGQLRTANEKVEEIIEIPQIEGISELKIEELGNVEAKVDNMLLIKAKTSGEYQVLESGSVLCLSDRTIIGVVSETLGRVQEPLYCVRFTNADAIAGFGLERGTSIHYIVEHSTFVFTQTLQAVKGSDASNIHDEEIGGDEIEFSDDEAEAEYKRQKKLQKQERKGMRDGTIRGRGDFARGGYRNHESQAPSTLSYDETTVDDELYTPLSRPPNLLMPGQFESAEAHLDGFSRGPRGLRGIGNRGRGGNRARGDRRNPPNGRHSQPYSRGGSNHSVQERQQPQSPVGFSYHQVQQQNIHTQPPQFQQQMPFQTQGVQYANHYQQFQPNNFGGTQQQYSQQYPQQPYSPSGQWGAFQQSPSTQTQNPQVPGQGVSGMPSFPTGTAYPHPSMFFPNQFQQQPPS